MFQRLAVIVFCCCGLICLATGCDDMDDSTAEFFGQPRKSTDDSTSGETGNSDATGSSSAGDANDSHDQGSGANGSSGNGFDSTGDESAEVDPHGEADPTTSGNSGGNDNTPNVQDDPRLALLQGDEKAAAARVLQIGGNIVVENGHVTEVNVAYKDFNDSFAPVLLDLPELRALDAHYTEVTDKGTVGYEKLTKLRFVNFGHTHAGSYTGDRLINTGSVEYMIFDASDADRNLLDLLLKQRRKITVSLREMDLVFPVEIIDQAYKLGRGKITFIHDNDRVFGKIATPFPAIAPVKKD